MATLADLEQNVRDIAVDLSKVEQALAGRRLCNYGALSYEEKMRFDADEAMLRAKVVALNSRLHVAQSAYAAAAATSDADLSV